MKKINTKEYKRFLNTLENNKMVNKLSSKRFFDESDDENKIRTFNPMFNSDVCDRFTRNILCELKSELIYSQNIFDIEFERIMIDNGFGYNFSIIPSGKSNSRRIMNENLLRIYEYVRSILFFLISDNILITSEINRNNRTAKFTLISRV